MVHFKEVSYKLENKVVELTQTLQRRTIENKELHSKVRALDVQLQSWMAKHDDVDARAKALLVEAQKPTVGLPEFEALAVSKRAVESQLEITLKKIQEQDIEIEKLMSISEQRAIEMERREVEFNALVENGTEDSETVNSLRTELSALREQLTRQVAGGATKGVARPEGGAFNPRTNAENGALATTANGGGWNGIQKRRPRRHSDQGADILTAGTDEEKWESPRAVSAAFPQEALRRIPNGKGYLPEVYDDPAEEIMKLLEDEEPLDADVLMGIIRHLKIPAPSSENPPSPKEVLFPAHLISLVTNEMWKYGMMRESERFLANVMQTVQQHVMVRRLASPPFGLRILMSDCCAIRAELHRGRSHHSRNILVVERSRDSVVRVHSRKRCAARYRTRRRGDRTRVRMGRLRTTGDDCQTRS